MTLGLAWGLRRFPSDAYERLVPVHVRGEPFHVADACEALCNVFGLARIHL